MKRSPIKLPATATISEQLAFRTGRWKELHQYRQPVMSARMFAMAQFIDSKGDQYIDLETLSTFQQGTVRGMLIRGYLEKAGRRVRWTRDGREAVRRFVSETFTRSVNNHKFTSFLDLETYDRAKNGAAGE